MRKDPYAKFTIDEEIKKQGIWYENEDVRVKVTFAGTENSRYDKMLKLKLKPFETQIRQETFSDERYFGVLAEVYAATVVLDFQVKKFENDEDEKGIWVQGVYAKDGSILEYSEENVIKAFILGKRLFDDVVKVATNFNLFRQGQKDGDGKNL